MYSDSALTVSRATFLISASEYEMGGSTGGVIASVFSSDDVAMVSVGPFVRIGLWLFQEFLGLDRYKHASIT